MMQSLHYEIVTGVDKNEGETEAKEYLQKNFSY